jgi:hypothetical protein
LLRLLASRFGKKTATVEVKKENWSGQQTRQLGTV